ncbi:MAG: GGDEF domain-containing protein, partial [Sphingomicrobium sp.]
WRWFESWCRGVVGKDGQVETLVNIVRDISERKQRDEQLAIAALTDPLTGLPNRRAFRNAAAEENIEQRSGVTALALIDIDYFKAVNDRYGHDAGDHVLTGFAVVAQRMLRRDDIIARVGGEEFAIIFPGLDLQNAAKACDRIRAAVANTAFPTAAGSVRITLSGGVALLGSDGLDGALRRADRALYEAKAKGRDRLSLAA